MLENFNSNHYHYGLNCWHFRSRTGYYVCPAHGNRVDERREARPSGGRHQLWRLRAVHVQHAETGSRPGGTPAVRHTRHHQIGLSRAMWVSRLRMLYFSLRNAMYYPCHFKGKVMYLKIKQCFNMEFWEKNIFQIFISASNGRSVCTYM